MMPGPLTVKVVWNKAVVVHGRLKKWMHSAFGSHGWIDLLEHIMCSKRINILPLSTCFLSDFVNNNGNSCTREILAPLAFY